MLFRDICYFEINMLLIQIRKEKVFSICFSPLLLTVLLLKVIRFLGHYKIIYPKIKNFKKLNLLKSQHFSGLLGKLN